MIYDRPDAVHRPAVRLLAGVVLLALLALGFLGNPPQVRAQVKWQDPVSLAAIPGGTAAGRFAPDLSGVVVDGSNGLSTSRQPILAWPNVPAGTTQVTFKITTLAARNPQTLWSSTVAVDAAGRAQTQVSHGVLQQGGTYIWQAFDAADPTKAFGPFGLSVDVQRSSVQQLWTSGPVSIGETTGELNYDWKGPSLATLGGPVGWSLFYRPSNRPSASLTHGWNLVVSGSSPWKSLALGADGALTLADTTGYALTFTKTGQNLWEPVKGAFGTQWRGGAPSQLEQSADGSYSVTDTTGMVTIFPAPVVGAASRPSTIWQDNKPTPQQTWTDGRLRTLTDPVSGKNVAFAYAPEADCAKAHDPGFVAAPNGALCAVADWAGNVTALEYVQTPKGVQLGRIVQGLGNGALAQVTDFGWDAAGRLEAIRSPRAASALASGALPGVSQADPRALTQIAYDAQGRVARVTQPAHLGDAALTNAAEGVRSAETFAYAPFAVQQVGATTPAGAQTRVWTDPATMRVTRTQDAAGRFFDYTYDASGNVTQLRDVRAGLVTETRYDALGRPTEQIGPTTAPNSPSAPRTITQYDRDANGNPWTGLLVRYWNTAGFVGAPVDAKVGPVLPGTSGVTPTLAFNWTSDPLGGSGPWSARLTGRFKADADGVYRLANTTSSPMWVNGKVCAPSCDVQLASGDSAYLQLDVSSAEGGAAGVNATVQRLDQTGAPQTAVAPISTASLRPNLNLATASTTNEYVPGQGVTPLTSRYTYDVNSGAITASQSPSGATITRAYAPYDPANGQYGEPTSITNAAGQTATTRYSKAGAFVSDCAGNAVQQVGLPNGTENGDSSVVQATAPNGAAMGVSTKGTIQCGDVSTSGNVTESAIAGTGDTYEVSHYLMVDNNPLHTGVFTGTGGGTTTEQTWFDITGTPWKTKDAFGTITTRDVDPATGLVRSATDTTLSGAKRTTSYTYTPTGDVKTIAIDGKTLYTKTYDTNGRVVRVDYADGTVQTTTYDGTSRPQTVKYLFADGKTANDTMVYSPSGRRLSRTIEAPDGTSTYAYRYNRDGRLIDTVKTGSSKTRETGWASTFDGPGGANGNRSSETITTPTGTSTAAFAYGADDQPMSTTKAGIAGAFTSDAAARITGIGGVSLVRDAAGNLQTATEGKKTIGLLTDASGGIARGYIDTSTANPVNVTAKSTGQGLVLNDSGAVAGQIVSDSGATIVLDAAGTPIRWSFNDQLGNAAWATDQGGKVGATRLYSPDGTTIAGAPQTSIKTSLDLATAGIGWQAASGAYTLPLKTPIVQLGSRTYAPDLGRFLEPDSAGSMNAYEYAVGDPINITDPSGQFGIWDLTGAIVATVAGLALGALTFGTGTFAGLGIAGTILLGAAIGAVSGALGNVAQTLVDGTPFDYKQLLLETALGAAFSVVGEGVSAGVAKGIRSFRAWKAGARSRVDARVSSRPVSVDEESLASSSYRPVDTDHIRTFRLNMFDDAVDPAALNQVVAAQASDVVFTAESAISRGALAARPNSVNIVQAADEMQGLRALPDISDTGSIVNGGSSRGTILGARDGLDEIKPGTLEDIFSEQQAWVVKQREDEAWKLIASGKEGTNAGWKPGDPVPWAAIPAPTTGFQPWGFSASAASTKTGAAAWFEWPETSRAYYQQYWKGLSQRNVDLANAGTNSGKLPNFFTKFNETFIGPVLR